MTKRFGFTLAEVLITLGIIGVVAAMTIPTLISNTNGAQFKTAYKKALSTLNQAILMNIAMEDTVLSTIGDDNATQANAGTRLSEILGSRMQSATEISASYPATGITLKENSPTPAAPIMDYTIQCENEGSAESPNWQIPAPSAGSGLTVPEGASCDATTHTAVIKKSMSTTVGDYVKYSFADGTAFWYNKNAYKCTDETATENDCYGFIDVNGATGPNTVIYCADAASGSCESSEITDMFPVIFHGQTFEPATDSARAVLFGK